MDAPDDSLLMSGIQHFAFCRRQWALIHLEQQWAENLRTTKVKPGKHCSACSLKVLCLPVLCRNADAKAYLRSHLDEAATEVTPCGNS